MDYRLFQSKDLAFNMLELSIKSIPARQKLFIELVTNINYFQIPQKHMSIGNQQLA